MPPALPAVRLRTGQKRLMLRKRRSGSTFVPYRSPSEMMEDSIA